MGCATQDQSYLPYSRRTRRAQFHYKDVVFVCCDFGTKSTCNSYTHFPDQMGCEIFVHRFGDHGGDDDVTSRHIHERHDDLVVGSQYQRH